MKKPSGSIAPARNQMIHWIFALVLSLSGTGTLLAQDVAVRDKVSFAAATLVDGGVTVNGELRIPAVSGAKLPAVVVIHGSGGLQDGVGTRYVEALNRAGIATLELDLFPRGGRPETPRFNFPHTYGSLIYLAKHPRIDPARIGVMGFSWGGALSLISATEELTRAYTGGAYRFAAHLPVYPVCWPHSTILQGKHKVFNASIYQAMTGSPVHILAGASDDFDDDPDACPKFIQALPASARSHVTVTVYPDAGHGFDLPKSEERTFQDPFAHRGHGGSVRYYGDAATADKAREFAVKFFESNLGAK
jgi:dienelactone hydrolase